MKTASAGWLGAGVLVALAAVLSSSGAAARIEAESDYSKAQTYNGALRYVRVDLGFEIVEKDPEVIVATYPNALETIRSRPGWSRIQAVRTGRICVYTGGEASLLSRPGPRVAQALRLLVDCFHGR